MLADEPYVTTRPHEARALLALGARDWAFGGDGGAPSDASTALALGAGKSCLVVLASDPEAAITATVDGVSAGPRPSEGAVRSFDLPERPPGAAARTAVFAVHASSGGVLALWLLAPPAPPHLIDRAGSRK